jgi:hypothetical protein
MKTNPNEFRDTLSPEEVVLEPSGQFAADLRNLRSAVHRAAERSGSRPLSSAWLISAKRRQRATQRRVMLVWGLVGTCAALLCLGTLPLLHRAAPVVEQPVAHQVQTQSPADDTALLEQVDSAVSESVPSSLAPLATLDEWNSTTSTNAAPTLNTPENKNVAQ